MTKKIKKLAVIRSDGQDACPFGLPISFGCKKACELVARMAPVDILGEEATEEEKEEIANANRRLLMWMLSQESCGRCKYAGKVFKDKDVVECNWETNVSGAQEGPALLGSPFYYRHFSGIGLDGLYSYPLGFYTDNSIDRSLFHGMYSIESTGQEKVELKKKSNEETESEEEAKIESEESEEVKEEQPSGAKFNSRFQNDLLTMLHFPSKFPFDDAVKRADDPEFDVEESMLDLVKMVATGKKMVTEIEVTYFLLPVIGEMTNKEIASISSFNDYIDQERLDKFIGWTKSLGLEHKRFDVFVKGKPFAHFFFYQPKNKGLLDFIEHHDKNKGLMKPGIYHFINGIIYGFSLPDIINHVMSSNRFGYNTKEELVQDMNDYFGEPFAGQLISEVGI